MNADTIGQVWRRLEGCRRQAADDDVASLLAEAIAKVEQAGKLQRMLDHPDPLPLEEDVPEFGGGS